MNPIQPFPSQFANHQYFLHSLYDGNSQYIVNSQLFVYGYLRYHKYPTHVHPNSLLSFVVSVHLLIHHVDVHPDNVYKQEYSDNLESLYQGNWDLILLEQPAP